MSDFLSIVFILAKAVDYDKVPQSVAFYLGP